MNGKEIIGTFNPNSDSDLDNTREKFVEIYDIIQKVRVTTNSPTIKEFCKKAQEECVSASLWCEKAIKLKYGVK